MVIRRNRGLAAAAVLLLAVSLAASARANMTTNPSYETGPPVPAGKATVGVGATTIDGWVVTRAPIDYVGDAYWEAAQGTRSLSLNTTATPGGIAQTIATIPGIAYSVSFMMSGEPFTFPELKWLRVTAAGQQADFSFNSSTAWHWSMEWSLRTWSFTANASATTIEFYSLMNVLAPPLIDNVTVDLVTTDVPAAPVALSLAVVSRIPSVGSATFAYSLPEAGAVELRVTDVLGREVASLVDGELPAGPHLARWGSLGAAPGVYFVTLRTGRAVIARRFVLLR